MRTALICAAVVTCLFGGYEIVERVWLRDADAKLLYVLHMVRGVASAAVVGALASWFLLRRFPAIFPSVERFSTKKSPSAEVAPDGESELALSGRWFLAARWYVVFILLGATLLGVHVLSLIPPQTFFPLLSGVVGLAASNFVYGHVLPRVKRHDRFLIFQIAVDLSFLTAILHFSGGIENPFSRVYIFHIVIASVLLGARSAYALTGLASVLLACLALGEARQWLPHYPIALFPYPQETVAAVSPALYMPFAIGKLCACLLVFWVTASFGVLLGNQLRWRGRELHRVAQDIQASEQKLQTVVNSMGAALMLWSKDLHLLWFNQTAREWFHLEEGRQEASCRLLSDSDATRAECSDCATLTALRKGTACVIERPHPLQEGTGRTLCIEAFPLRDAGGDVAQILELVQDVTNAKAMEAELLHSTKMAVLGRMAGAVAHEIGNPLSSIAARLERLEREDGSAFVRESLPLLREQVDRVHRLVASITRFSRPSALRPAVCDVVAVLEQVVAMLRMDRHARNVVIEKRLPISLPPVFAIRDQLVQVFLNLGLNALEAMPAGGRLVVGAGAADGRLHVVFADTGCGLTQEARENLFRPFFTTKEEGTGLGLFLSHRIVCVLGGAIRAEAVPAGGTRFEVLLPAANNPAGGPS